MACKGIARILKGGHFLKNPGFSRSVPRFSSFTVNFKDFPKGVCSHTRIPWPRPGVVHIPGSPWPRPCKCKEEEGSQIYFRLQKKFVSFPPLSSATTVVLGTKPPDFGLTILTEGEKLCSGRELDFGAGGSGFEFCFRFHELVLFFRISESTRTSPSGSWTLICWSQLVAHLIG
jgi:hypothetical protein